MPSAFRVGRNGRARDHSVRIKSLMKQVRSPDPRRAMLLRVTQALGEFREASLPVNVEVLANSVVNAEVIRRPISLDGLTFPTPRGPVLVVNESAPRRRQRFSIAHEICHLLISSEVTSSDGPVHVHDEEEERLCDLGASEILMPEPAFGPAAVTRPASLDTLMHLSEMFDASIQAVALRLQRGSVWGNQWSVIGWNEAPSGGLHITWLAGPPSTKRLLWPWTTASDADSIGVRQTHPYRCSLVEMSGIESRVRAALRTGERTGAAREYIRRGQDDILVHFVGTVPYGTSESQLISLIMVP